MPEFVLSYGTPDAARAFQALDAFTQGYVEAMFFTSTGIGDDAELEHATFAELAPEALEHVKATCARFQALPAFVAACAAKDDSTVTFDDEQAGRDFWFTRNGHGVGFWDRAPDVYGPHADALSAAARYSEQYMHRGDDGQIYVEGAL